jgi:hypothetical protein
MVEGTTKPYRLSISNVSWPAKNEDEALSLLAELHAHTTWSDGELMRAIREGISKDGSGLFPLMPYRDYASLSDEDTRAIVAFLRTLLAGAIRGHQPE